MKSWNYRIMKTEVSDSVFEYGIHEVFYDKHGKVQGWTENSLTPRTESPKALFEELENLKTAFDKEILDNVE